MKYAFGGGDGVPVNFNIRPIAGINLDDPDEVLGWMKDTSSELVDYYSAYRSLYYDNMMMYMGIEKKDDWVSWTYGSDLTDYRKRSRTGNFNLIQPIVESFVSRLSSSRTHVSVLPQHSDEYKDLAAAKTAKSLIEQSFRANKADRLFESAARTMLVTGAAYVLLEWDPHAGPLKPEAMSQPPGPSIQKVDEEGQPLETEDDEPIVYREPSRLGDVVYRMLRPDQVLEQPANVQQDQDWIITHEVRSISKLREHYPDFAEEIKGGEWNPGSFAAGGSWYYDVGDHEVIVFTLYHKATAQFPKGLYIRATKDVILEISDMPFRRLAKHGILPIVRIDDTIPPGYQLPLPMTVMETGKAYQETFNKVNGNILRNMSLNTPKWIVNQASGVRPAHLNNLTNIVMYKGDRGMSPALESPPSTPGELFQFRNQIMQELQVNTGSSHSLNTPPPNTRAAAMLEHQEEQEFKRSEPLIKHMNDGMADVAKIALNIMAERYRADDGRLIEMVGPGGTTKYAQFETADLAGTFDVKYERTSALPESKQGRLNEAARLFQLGLIDRRQYEKIIGYDADPELATPETLAYEKQLLENDMIARGGIGPGGQQRKVPPPLEHEDHVEHLRALYPIIQSAEFGDMPGPIKAMYVSHCMAHEMFAWKRAHLSIKQAMKLDQLTQFPLFFTKLPAAMPPSQENRPPLEAIKEERLKTPGLSKPSPGLMPASEPPGPGNPEAV